MQNSNSNPARNIEDRDLACTFSPWKFYFLLAFTFIVTSVFVFRTFRLVVAMAQHFRLS